ncbi:MAG TPA: hypothetical protein VHZ76_00740 [Gammaproteobacteria bacterium]|jgi:hypothetical protein|nr:hypothetical protein [Gammaproteobacteria bacterium]
MSSGVDHYLSITNKIGTLGFDAQALGLLEGENASAHEIAKASKQMIKTHRELIDVLSKLVREFNELRDKYHDYE